MKFRHSQWIFALKIYLSVMASFLITSRIGLSQTYWSILTCCVLMNPFSGATRAKSVHRMIGTLAGGLAALFFTSLFASTPVLMLICLGLTSGAGFSLALLDRTPRNYGFRIFSLTLMVVALPGVGHPLTIFDTTVERIFQISIAVLCTAVVDSLILPSSMRPVILGKVAKWIKDTEEWTTQAFHGRIREARTNHDRLKALADISAMTAMAGQLRHDHGLSRADRGAVFAIQNRLVQVAPKLTCIAHALADAGPETRERFSRILLDRFDKLQSPDVPPVIDPAELKPSGPPWESLVQENLAQLAQTVLALWGEVRCFQAFLSSGKALPYPLKEEAGQMRAFPLRPDSYLALRVFWGYLLVYALLCGVWFITGWAQSPRAILLAAITAGFFGATVAPGRAIVKLGRYLLLIMLITGVFCFCILPLTRDLLSFALAMAVFIIPIGAWSAKNIMARLILSLGISTMNLETGFVPMGVDTFIDAFAANFFGVFAAFSCLGFVRSMVTDHALKRLLEKGRQDILALTLRTDKKILEGYKKRSMNRVSLYAARLAQEGYDRKSDRIMSLLIAGMSIADLCGHAPERQGELGQAMERLFTAIRRDLFAPEWPASLRGAIDKVLCVAWNQGQRSGQATLLGSLIHLRLALFEGAPAWRPES